MTYELSNGLPAGQTLAEVLALLPLAFPGTGDSAAMPTDVRQVLSAIIAGVGTRAEPWMPS